MIHGNEAHQIRGGGSLRWAAHSLTSHPTPHSRRPVQMLIHVRRVPGPRLNLSSQRVSTVAEWASEEGRGGGGGGVHPGDCSSV